MTPSDDLHFAGAPASAAEFALDARIAYAILRLTLGINIALHGVTRIANGTGGFAELLVTQFQATLLPRIVIEAFADTLPWAETAIGLLVLAGLATRFALIAGGLLMAVLTFGTTLRQDFQNAGLQLFYSIAYFMLLSLRSRNGFSLDAWLQGRSTTANASV
jgi:thiosulfate dehydrogenase (quinone) large subunit